MLKSLNDHKPRKPLTRPEQPTLVSRRTIQPFIRYHRTTSTARRTSSGRFT